MTNDEQVIEVLERIEAAVRASGVPPAYRWIDAAGVAAMLGMATRHFAERIAYLPGFPKPARVRGGERKWRMDEVQQWMVAQQREAAPAYNPKRWSR